MCSNNIGFFIKFKRFHLGILALVFATRFNAAWASDPQACASYWAAVKIKTSVTEFAKDTLNSGGANLIMATPDETPQFFRWGLFGIRQNSSPSPSGIRGIIQRSNDVAKDFNEAAVGLAYRAIHAGRRAEQRYYLQAFAGIRNTLRGYSHSITQATYGVPMDLRLHWTLPTGLAAYYLASGESDPLTQILDEITHEKEIESEARLNHRAEELLLSMPFRDISYYGERQLFVDKKKPPSREEKLNLVKSKKFLLDNAMVYLAIVLNKLPLELEPSEFNSYLFDKQKIIDALTVEFSEIEPALADGLANYLLEHFKTYRALSTNPGQLLESGSVALLGNKRILNTESISLALKKEIDAREKIYSLQALLFSQENPNLKKSLASDTILKRHNDEIRSDPFISSLIELADTGEVRREDAAFYLGFYIENSAKIEAHALMGLGLPKANSEMGGILTVADIENIVLNQLAKLPPPNDRRPNSTKTPKKK